MKRTILASAMLGSLMTSAHATGSIDCTGIEDTDVGVLVSIGRLPFLAVLNGRFFAGDESWTTEGLEGSTKIDFAQGFQDTESTRIDFTNEMADEIVVKLRLFRDFDDKTGAEAGILSITGTGVFAVTCESG